MTYWSDDNIRARLRWYSDFELYERIEYIERYSIDNPVFSELVSAELEIAREILDARIEADKQAEAGHGIDDSEGGS